MNRDQLNMVPAWYTIQTAYAAVSAAQDSPKPQQVMGLVVLFYELCIRLQLDPSEMLDKARRLVRHAEDHHSLELEALRNYIKEEFAT